MIYYIVAFALSLALCEYMGTPKCSVNGVRTKRFQNLQTVCVVLLPLIFLALFRWNVGADSVYGQSYSDSYHAAADGINKRDFEIGFYWFMRLFAELEIPFFWFLFAHGCLFFGFVVYAIHKGSVWGIWSVALFFLLTVYFDSYSSLRQSLAEAICLVGWAKMGADRNGMRKDISIIALFLVASLFHNTGLMNIPIYLLCKLRFRKREDILILAIVAIMLTPLLQRILPMLMNYFTPDDKYSTLGLSRINMLVTGLFFFVSWLFYDEISCGSENGFMYANQSLYIFILILNSGAMFLPYRVYDMLKIGYIMIVPQIVSNIKNNKSRFLIGALFAGICVAMYMNFVSQPGSPYSSYQSAFSDWWNIINLP